MLKPRTVTPAPTRAPPTAGGGLSLGLPAKTTVLPPATAGRTAARPSTGATAGLGAGAGGGGWAAASASSMGRLMASARRIITSRASATVQTSQKRDWVSTGRTAGVLPSVLKRRAVIR